MFSNNKLFSELRNIWKCSQVYEGTFSFLVENSRSTFKNTIFISMDDLGKVLNVLNLSCTL